MIVGIDVSKDKLDVHISATAEHCIIKNTKASIANFFKNKINLKDLEQVVFEATGGYERALHFYLLEKRCLIIGFIHPVCIALHNIRDCLQKRIKLMPKYWHAMDSKLK